MFDLEIIETGGGGDCIKRGNDFATTQSFKNFPYLALFGHRGGQTKSSYAVNEFRTDWWGNSLLHPQEPAAQFNSTTEDRLHDTPLTSAGRLIIEEAIKYDLQFMRPFAQITVVTEIIATDQLKINIRLIQPDNLEQKDFVFIWDAVKQELLDPNNIYNPNPNPLTDEALQYELGFYL